MKNKKLVFILSAVIIIALPIAWYLLSPLFIDNVVEENQVEGDIIYEGEFSGADSFHQVSGQAQVTEDNGIRYLRLENFESTNGPDLKVYLSEDSNADSYVSLGELKGNIGSQNYEIPEGADLEKYSKVLIWCEQFSVLFGEADLS